MYFVPDPYTGYRLQPNSIGYYQDNTPTIINSNGHRDDESNPEKDKGVFRILVLGDSFTMGVNVRQEETYPQILERTLNEQFKETRIEVINAGVAGWEPFQYAQYYEHYGRQFKPDLILIGFFVGNDTYNQISDVSQTATAVSGRLITRQDAANTSIGLKVFLFEHFHLARLILHKGQPLTQKFTRVNCQDFTKEYLMIQTQRMENHLKRDQNRLNLAKNSVYQILKVKRMADPEHIPVVVVLLPDENQINLGLQQKILTEDEFVNYDFDMPQSMLIEMFQYVGISKVINPLPEFKKDSGCLYMNDTHFSPAGHELAAKVIFEEIKSYIPIRG